MLRFVTKVLLTTGKYNLVHTGHTRLIQDANRFDATVIGICDSKTNKVPYFHRKQALLELAKDQGIETFNIQIIPVANPFELVSVVKNWLPHAKFTLRLGEDRLILSNKIINYYSSLDIKQDILDRDECSSTRCREYFSSNGGSKGLQTYWDGSLAARDRAYTAYCREKQGRV